MVTHANAKGWVRSTLDQLWLIDSYRFACGLIRYVYFVFLNRGLKTLEDSENEGKKQWSLRKSFRGLSDLARNQSLILIRPASVLCGLSPSAKVLILGSETEGEVMNFVAHGFSFENIRAISPVNYSPWIELGDPARTTFVDHQFDLIYLGWSLEKVSDPADLIKEVKRLARPGGYVAYAATTNPQSEEGGASPTSGVRPSFSLIEPAYYFGDLAGETVYTQKAGEELDFTCFFIFRTKERASTD